MLKKVVIGKRIIIRFISIVLISAFLYTIITPIISLTAYAVEETGEKYYYRLNSNVMDRDSILLYEYDGVEYIIMNDLCSLTRSKAELDGQIFTVTQGIKGTTFDYEKQQFCDGWQTVEVTLISTDTYYLVPAVEFLTYFGANVRIDKTGETFYCTMPDCTAWEAMAVDYKNTLIDIYKLYGGEGNVTLSLTLDILMDFILNGAPNNDDYLADAYNEALSINMCDFSAIQEYQTRRDVSFYDYLISDEGQDAVDYVSKILDNSISGVEYLCESYYNTTNLKFADLVKSSHEAGFLDESTYYAEQILNGYRKNKSISDVATNSKIALTQVAPVFIQTALESAQQLKYVTATNNLAYRVMGDENIKYLGLDVGNNGWFRMANTYKSTATVVSNTFLGNAESSFSDMGWDHLIGDCVQSFTGTSALLFTFSKECATSFAKWFPLTKPGIEAFEADRQAIYLSELQQNVAYVISNIDFSKNYEDEELYQKYIEAALLYCRVSIAMYQKLITMVNEFGNNRDYWTSIFQNRIDVLAVSMYKLTLFQDDKASECIPLNLSDWEKLTALSCDFEYEIRTEVIEFKTSDGVLYYSNTVEYPYFLGATQTELKINQRYEKVIADFRNNEIDVDSAYKVSLEWSIGPPPYYDNIKADVVYNKNGAVSIKETSIMWSGGMHPYYEERGITYDKETGIELAFSDILVGTAEQVDKVLRSAMSTALGYVPTEYMLTSLKDNTAYSLCDLGLCFYYNIGDAVPREEIIIPFTDKNSFIISADRISTGSVANIVDYGTCGENLTWKLTNEGVLTISGIGNMEDFKNIKSGRSPWSSYAVTTAEIAPIRAVIIEDGVESIGNYAFYECVSMKSVVISNSVTSIGEAAFYECSRLDDVTISAGVTNIGNDAFVKCEALAAFEVDSGNPYYCSNDGILFNKEQTKLLCYPSGKQSQSYIVPETVVSISRCAFKQNRYLSSVTIPSSVIEIGNEAFQGCVSLSAVIIGTGISVIGKEVFDTCSNLFTITLPDSLVSIGERSFYGSGLYSIIIPVSVTNIGYEAFGMCKELAEVYYSGSISQWGAISIDNINKGNSHLLNATIYYER